MTELVYPKGDLALVVVASVRLPVGFEAPPLPEVEQSSANMVKRQLFRKRTSPQRIGRKALTIRMIAGFAKKRVLRVLVTRHQPIFDQRPQRRLAPPQIAIPPARHGAGLAAGNCQRGFGLRIATIGVDARADVYDAVGFAIFIKRVDAPADRICAYIECV